MKKIETRLHPLIARWLAAAESGAVTWQIAWDAIQSIELAVAETCEHLKEKHQSIHKTAEGAYEAIHAAKSIINSRAGGTLKLTYIGRLETPLQKAHLNALHQTTCS